MRIDFICASTLEIVADEEPKRRIVATLKLMGIVAVGQFDALRSAIRTSRTGVSDCDRKKWNVSTAIHRLHKNRTKTNNQCAHTWYDNAHKKARRMLQELSTEINKPQQQGDKDSNTNEAEGVTETEQGWTELTRERVSRAQRERRNTLVLHTGRSEHTKTTSEIINTVVATPNRGRNNFVENNGRGDDNEQDDPTHV